MNVLSMIADCLEDLAKGNPSPNAFNERIEALREQAREDARENDRPAGGEVTADETKKEEVQNAVG